MKRFKHLLPVLLLLMSLTAAIISCKKGGDDPTPTPTPAQPVTTITSISPATAPVGSTIAIGGTNFGTSPTSNTVTIGGVVATIVSVTDTQIVVVVPTGAANGPVSVTAGGQTAQSQSTFTVYVAPLKPVVEISGTTFANQNWTRDKIYLLKGLVYIPADFTLTIEAGTVIKGAAPDQDPDKKNMAGTLIIERRAKIIAQGTASQPIVFTSAKAAGQRAYGDWGGLVLIGKAAMNTTSTAALPGGVRGTVERYAEFNDNSGTLRYVRIEYAGAAQPTGSATRLSGLSLYGVGNSTVIDHVQVSYSGSDSFAWFGGTANLKNLVAYRSFDDDWSADWGYVGNVQFGVAVRDPDVADQSGSNGLELENYDPTATTDVTPVVLANGLQQTAPVFANLSSFGFGTTPTTNKSAKGTGAYLAGLYLRRNAAVAVYNSLLYGYPEGVSLGATGATPGVTNNTIDLQGIVLANVLTPVVGNGVLTSDLTTTYFTTSGRANQIVQSSDLTALRLNNFNATTPGFLPQSGSSLLTGAVTGGKLANSFFTPTTFRGAFGTDDWTTGWTNFFPQNTDYDR
ncbi:IPT/TIG domain-containing protein [Spirosoma agri]|uniref:Cell shape-determining protein MreB n=1 Tax=Spirosoma agri TaxID=1987381 RepID=A0A6M0IPT7_9BACT|nr:IPT/TIG domain-containing protein [Spirosoma agri]NEU69565.1 cell shape-determining protein MreB [Spirosoma agri]